MSDDKELLSLADLKERYNINPNTIKRERWEQRQIQKGKDVDVRNPDGLGFKLDSVCLYRKIYYRKTDVENYIKAHTTPAPEKALSQ
jgi:hypothetical protein